MDQSITSERLYEAESLLVAGEDQAAHDLLADLTADIEEYVSRNCPTSDEVQWFSFPTIFERLAYRRVEGDPRELQNIDEPFDRVYATLALSDIRLGEYDDAIEALKQAARWNPMECSYRLTLAELFRLAGNAQEHLALTYSVFERASEAAHLEQAYLTFADYFEQTKNDRAAAAALFAARKLDVSSQQLTDALAKAKGTPRDPDTLDDAQATEALAAEGLPAGANAEIAICLLMCATDAAEAGQADLATTLTLRARDLVGEPAAMTLLDLIRGGDGSGEKIDG